MAEFFTKSELTRSDVAKTRGIDNTPTPEVSAALDALMWNVLDPIRRMWGHPIIVNSGYRCPEVKRGSQRLRNVATHERRGGGHHGWRPGEKQGTVLHDRTLRHPVRSTDRRKELPLDSRFVPPERTSKRITPLNYGSSNNNHECAKSYHAHVRNYERRHRK